MFVWSFFRKQELIKSNRSNSLNLNKRTSLRFSNGAIGLVNMGNTCYLNSGLQNLKNVFPLTNYLLSTYSDYDRNGFTFKYCELISNLINQNTNHYFEPREFFTKLSELIPTFHLGQQNDSNFFIIYILSLLERETKRYNETKFMENIQINLLLNEEQEKNKLKEFLLKFKQKRNSPIISIFYGFQEDIYFCRKCKYNKINFQGFSVLNLSIMANNNPIYTLENAIKYYQNEQIYRYVNYFSCPICRGNDMSTKSVIIFLPPILIINLKRIGEKKIYNHNLEIPMNLKFVLKSIDYEYELIGFIKHIGEANSGHNIAICKNFFDNIWYVYDDNKVFFIGNSIYGNNNKIDTSDGFLFFYKKRDYIINNEEKMIIINKSKELRK